jgi:transcriptional regulator of acetoin/glycerol metabolism
VGVSGEETLQDAQGRRKLARAPEILVPHLFVALDCDRPNAGVARYSLANVDRVLIGRGSARGSVRSFEGGARLLTISIPDACVSSRHATIVRDGIDFTAVDLDSRNGTRVNGCALGEQTRLADGDLVQIGHTILRYRTAVSVPVGEAEDLDLALVDDANVLPTVDPSLARHASALQRVARSKVPVLLFGETGTGKEVLARRVHRLSGREGPFVAVNCGAIPENLVEAQLFGHVRGAFSGAVAGALGLLRSADGGTLLLDEIGDLPLTAQVALLRALQEQEVVPIGSVRSIKIDFRIVAATHQPLEQLVARGEFRSDLFARIAGFAFHLPPVRARREDIGQLVAALTRGERISLTPDAGRALLDYDWPLNVREIHQALDVAASLASERVIEVGDLPPAVAQFRSSALKTMPTTSRPDWLQTQLTASLTRHRGNISEVAREFGKARMQVQRWMKRFGMNADSFR